MGLTCGKGRKKSLECDIGNVVSGHSQELFIQNKILDYFFFKKKKATDNWCQVILSKGGMCVMKGIKEFQE